MNINEDLLKAANFNPTKRSHLMSIGDMCGEIEKRSISLPLYQRDMSWSIAKCVSLLNYQLLGKAPVSPISVNIINDVNLCVPQISFIEREIIRKIERGQISVVDGQQRLTTNFKAYINHNDFRNVVLDLERGSFIEIGGAIEDNQIPVGILLNKDDSLVFRYIRNRLFLDDLEVKNLLLQIRSKIKNYNYTINEATNLTEDEQIQWFEVLNNAGSRVSQVQMSFSKLKEHDIDIYVMYINPFNERLKEIGYLDVFKGKPKTTTTTYPVSALNASYEIITGHEHSSNFAANASNLKHDQLCSLPPNQLKECFAMTLDTLNVAIDFIESNRLKKPERIDYINYLIAFFIFHDKNIDKATRKFLVNWYNTVTFKNKTNTERREIYTELINYGLPKNLFNSF